MLLFLYSKRISIHCVHKSLIIKIVSLMVIFVKIQTKPESFFFSSQTLHLLKCDAIDVISRYLSIWCYNRLFTQRIPTGKTKKKTKMPRKEASRTNYAKTVKMVQLFCYIARFHIDFFSFPDFLCVFCFIFVLLFFIAFPSAKFTTTNPKQKQPKF